MWYQASVGELLRSSHLPLTALSVDLGTHSHQGVDLQQHVEVWVVDHLVSLVPVQHEWLHFIQIPPCLHISNKISSSYSPIRKLVHDCECPDTARNAYKA